jgi:translocation and assembly module TamA
MRFRAQPAVASAILAGVLVLAGARDSGAAVDYELVVECSSEELGDLLYDESSLVLEKERPLATLRGVRRRATADEDLFLRLLRSRGYYAASLRWTLVESSGPEGVAEVRFLVDPGPVYPIRSVDIRGLPPEATFLTEKKGLRRLGLKPGEPGAASSLLAARKQLVTELVKLGYPFAAIEEDEFAIDHAEDRRDMSVTFVVSAGPRAYFGDSTVEGDRKVDPEYVLRRLTFERGALYDPDEVEESRRKLIDAGVFSAVSISHADTLDEEGLLPMRVKVTENKARTVGAGASFSSAQGVGLKAFWEHRNLLGGAEGLRIEGEANQLGFRLLSFYREPDFLEPDQNLLLEFSAAAEDTDAYRSDSLRAAAGVERPLGASLTGGAGVSFEQTAITGSYQDDDFTLIGFPALLRYDTTDDLLDATMGHRLGLYVTPYFDPLDQATSFISLRLNERYYKRLDSEDRYVFAGRFAVGSIQGATGNDVPLTKRFYAGGADSVRGYDYQFVGPLDEDNDPRGGLSLVQFGAEIRWKITPTLGLVPFLEAANVYEDSVPDFSGEFFWGAGLGARYYTVAGPLRVDVGFPLNARDGVDDFFELYISLGQAF